LLLTIVPVAIAVRLTGAGGVTRASAGAGRQAGAGSPGAGGPGSPGPAGGRDAEASSDLLAVSGNVP
jgi:hypothetical protein